MRAQSKSSRRGSDGSRRERPCRGGKKLRFEEPGRVQLEMIEAEYRTRQRSRLLRFDSSTRAAAAIAPHVAHATQLPDDYQLKIALADFVTHQKKVRGLGSKADISVQVWRELDRLAFALPDSSMAVRASVLLDHHWDHKAAIIATIKDKLSLRCREFLSSVAFGAYDHIISRAFRRSKVASQPISACVRYLERKAEVMGAQFSAPISAHLANESSGSNMDRVVDG